MAEKNLGVAARLRPALAGFEPYDPAFTPCRVNLSANENTHPLPAGVRAAIDAALLATPLNRYPDPMANELRDELADRYGRPPPAAERTLRLARLRIRAAGAHLSMIEARQGLLTFYARLNHAPVRHFAHLPLPDKPTDALLDHIESLLSRLA